MRKQRGGKRPGSGRKPVSSSEPLIEVTVTLLQSQVTWLRSQTDNVSQFVRNLVEKEMHHDNQDPNVHRE